MGDTPYPIDYYQYYYYYYYYYYCYYHHHHHHYCSCRKLAVLKPEDTRRVGEPKLKWLESVEGELKNFLSNWRRKLQDREQWRTVLVEATVRHVVERQK